MGTSPSSGRSAQLGEVHLTHTRSADGRDDLVEHHVRDRRVDGHGEQRVTTLPVAADLHAGDVDVGLAEDAPDGADDAGPVLVAEDRHVLGEDDLDVEAVDLDELLDVAGTRERARQRDLAAVGHGAAHGDQVAIVG